MGFEGLQTHCHPLRRLFGGLAIAGPGGAAVGSVGGAVAGGVVGGVAGHSGIDDAIYTTKTLIRIKLAEL